MSTDGPMNSQQQLEALCHQLFNGDGDEINDDAYSKLSNLLNETEMLPHLDFNQYVKTKFFNGTILALFAYIAATYNRADLLLIKTLNADLRKLDFGHAIKEGEYAGMTPLLWMAFLAADNKPMPFSILVKRKNEFDFAKLGFAYFPTTGEFKDKSALCWLVLACVKHDQNRQIKAILKQVLESDNLKASDLNHKMSSGMFDGTTPLWWLAWLAKEGQPQFLAMAVKKVKIEELDFKTCANNFELDLDLEISGAYRYNQENGCVEKTLTDKNEIHLKEHCSYNGVSVDGLLSMMTDRLGSFSITDSGSETNLVHFSTSQQTPQYEEIQKALSQKGKLSTDAKKPQYTYQSHTSKPQLRRT